MKKEYTDTAIYVSTLEEYFKIKETHILSQKIISVCSECHTIFTRTLLSLKKKDKLICSHCGHALGAKAMTPEKYKKRTCKTKQTLQKRYGVTNISQLDSVKKKKEETTIKNYGSKYFWTSETSKQLVEAKYECAKKNNVKIIYADTYNTFIQYVIERYGKDFFLKYKK